jgi:hypothetical protein
MGPPSEYQSVGELMSQLTRETGTLVQKQIELATTELTAKAGEAARSVAVVATGGALVHAGLLIFLAALVIGLAQLGVQPWLAAVIVAVLTMIAGYAAVATGNASLRRIQFAPRHTIETLKENAKWTSGQGA